MARKQAIESEIAAHQEEIEARQAELREIDLFLSVYQRFATNPQPSGHTYTVALTAHPTVTSDVTVTVETRRGLSQENFERIGRELLLRKGEPAMGPEFMRLFREAGTPVGGENEYKNFQTKVWKAKKKGAFININKKGYWPKDEPGPAFGYFPLSGSAALGNDLRQGNLLVPEDSVNGEPDDLTPDELEALIIGLIRQKGHPMPRSELVNALRKRISIPAKNPGPWLGMRLNRSRAFKNFVPNGWWPAHLPYEPMNYAPEVGTRPELRVVTAVTKTG